MKATTSNTNTVKNESKNTVKNTKNMKNTMKDTKIEEMSFPMYATKLTSFPLLRTLVQTEDGKKLYGIFIVDTGSQNNVLYKGVEKFVPLRHLKGKSEIMGVENSTAMCSRAKMSFSLEGLDFDETFLVTADETMINAIGPSCLGILGLDFITKYHLAVDYSSLTIHTGHFGAPEFGEHTYYFPIYQGWDMWQLPLVMITSNGKTQCLCIADSGSNSCVMTEVMQKDLDFRSKSTGERMSLNSIGKVTEQDVERISFRLTSADPKCEHVKYARRTYPFQIIRSMNAFIEPNGEERGKKMPICCILGNEFMRREQWVIDFAGGWVYSKKKSGNRKTA